MVPPSSSPGTAVRPEIQLLRALAVGAVVLHHGWPAVTPAGYMGVDVFFVVSGFLITGLLVREAGRAGRISLRGFYLRRARRILPAAVAVLAFVSAMTFLVVPQAQWASYFRQVVASALYVENWQLAADSQNPRRDELVSTPVQHYWSLSVEEQFYLVWPLLLIAALWLARRSGRSGVRTAVVVVGAVTVASFVHCLVLTAQDHNLAYFSTFARAWEFGAGALLALLAGSVPAGRDGVRSVAGWAGLAIIVVPILAFRSPEAFPGIVSLLPVVGALVFIWGGMPLGRWSPARLSSLRPVQWTGDISYSLYLWHWPIFMFVPFLTGVPSPPWLMVLLVGVSFAVAAASKRWVEDPVRYGRGGRRPRAAAVLGGVASAVVLVVVAAIVGPEVASAEACERTVPAGR